MQFCKKCKQLLKDKQQATKNSDWSRVTDIQVLLRRCCLKGESS